MKITDTCAAPGCGRLAWKNRSRYCSTHMMTRARYGSPTGEPIRLCQYERHEQYLDKGLKKYERTTGVLSSLKRAEEILNYRAAQGFTVQLTIEREMRRLREHGVTPREFLLRVAAHFAYIQVRPFSDDKAARAALSRAVLRLAPLNGYRPLCRLLDWLADEITNRLGLFGDAFVKRLEKDADDERAQRRSTTDFDSLEENPR